MNEGFEDVLKKGFDTWRTNLVLGAPFIFELMAFILFYIVFILLFLAVFFLSLALGAHYLHDIFSRFPDTSFLVGYAILLSLFFTVLYFIGLAITSFFVAGAIGMAKEATEKGKTRLDDMFVYGKERVKDMFFAELIFDLMNLAGVSLIFLAVLGMSALLTEIMSHIVWPLLFIGLLFAALYFFVLKIVFSPLRYIVVLEGKGAVRSIKATYGFFMKNKFEVFLLWFIAFFLFSIVGVFQFLVNNLLALVPIIGGLCAFVFQLLFSVIFALTLYPIVICWWTRLCLDRRTTRSPQAKPPQDPGNESQEPIYISPYNSP